MAIKRDEAGWMNLENITLIKEVSHQGYILYDSIYMKGPEWTNPQ